MNESEKTQTILNILLEDGYSSTSSIHEVLQSQISMQAIRNHLRFLKEEKLVSHKRLSTNSETGMGSGEMVHFLSNLGLQTLGKQGSEIMAYKKRLSRIRLDHCRHYLKTRCIEKRLTACINGARYEAMGCNEFSDTGVLSISLKHKGKFVNFRSDAQVRILSNGFERLTIRIEMDMGTQSIYPTIIKKFESYSAFFKSELAEKYSKTFPVFLLFVCSQEKIAQTLKKIRNKNFGFILFLPHEKLQENIFEAPVIVSSDGKTGSLQRIVAKREPILNFKEAIECSKKQEIYQFFVSCKYTTCHDQFFPILLHLNGKDILWTPEAYLRIKRMHQDTLIEKLFGLVLVIEGNETEFDEIRNKLAPYDFFLSENSLRQRVTESNCYGMFIVLLDESKTERIQAILKNFAMSKRTRIIRKSDCIPGKILYEPVWLGAFDTIALIKEHP